MSRAFFRFGQAAVNAGGGERDGAIRRFHFGQRDGRGAAGTQRRQTAQGGRADYRQIFRHRQRGVGLFRFRLAAACRNLVRRFQNRLIHEQAFIIYGPQRHERRNGSDFAERIDRRAAQFRVVRFQQRLQQRNRFRIAAISQRVDESDLRFASRGRQRHSQGFTGGRVGNPL